MALSGQVPQFVRGHAWLPGSSWRAREGPLGACGNGVCSVPALSIVWLHCWLTIKDDNTVGGAVRHQRAPLS